MKKLAAFVEGQTEQLLIERLLEEVAGKNHISIEKRQAFGGRSGKRNFTIQGSASNSTTKFYAQITDCGTDNRVASDVIDNYASLVSAGFTSILAVRDVYPDFTYADIPKLRQGLRYKVKTNPVDVIFVLGVMEIESWFISEHTHFEKLDSSLTPTLIKSRLGFDPSTDDMQVRPHPAEDLDNIYRLVGRSYEKTRSKIQKTLALMDYERIYVQLSDRILDLGILVKSINNFLST